MNYTQEIRVNNDNIELINYLPNIGVSSVREEILEGLRATQKQISPKFFYDGNGSNLFEQITHLEEYYPTRTEKRIISTIGNNLDLEFKDLNIVELGSGDSSKISLLFKQIPVEDLKTVTYFPVDISQSAIEKSARELTQQFTLKNITGIVVDFFHQLKLIPKPGKRLFCFFGSTIGNFNIEEAKTFMTLLGSTMQKGDSLLLGMDMVKDISVLEKAYNDTKGVTTNFNKNILNVVNNLTDSNFNTSDFEHWAFFNNEKRRIEMHLRALKNVEISLSSKTEKIKILKGETIHTENSYKYSLHDIKMFGMWAGIETKNILADKNSWFSLVHYEKTN